jgi:hypothetical protein
MMAIVVRAIMTQFKILAVELASALLPLRDLFLSSVWKAIGAIFMAPVNSNYSNAQQ